MRTDGNDFTPKLNRSLILLCLIICVLVSVLFYLFFDYTHRKTFQPDSLTQDQLQKHYDKLQNTLHSIESEKITFEELPQPEKKLTRSAETVKTPFFIKEFTEEKLFELLDLEREPRLLDKLMDDLLIKNNSTSTPEETCSGDDLLEREECKKNLFIGCAEALYLRFAIVNECTQFPKEDYIKYLKIKRQYLKHSDNPDFKLTAITTSVGEILPSNFKIDVDDWKDTIDSSQINNDFTRIDYDDLLKETEAADKIVREEDVETEKKQSKTALSSLLTSLVGVRVHYSGWIQGWATIFAVLGGRPESGYKMYKTTAFGFNPYKKDVCLISLPYKTVDKFFGTKLNYCIRNRLYSCIQAEKEKVKGKPIEVHMIRNNKRMVFPLGDLGPAEWTGNAIDLNGCVAKKLGATGKDWVRFRVAR